MARITGITRIIRGRGGWFCTTTLQRTALRLRRAVPSAVTSDHSFTGQLSFFEVKKQGHFQDGNVEVAEHLGDVSFVEGADYLGVGDDFVVHDEVRHQLADEVATVVD